MKLFVVVMSLALAVISSAFADDSLSGELTGIAKDAATEVVNNKIDETLGTSSEETDASSLTDTVKQVGAGMAKESASKAIDSAF